MAIFDSESICVEVENFRDTEATTWIGKHIPNSASIVSNLIQEPVLFCDPNPCYLVSTSSDALNTLARQRKAHMNKKGFQIGAIIKTWLAATPEVLNHRRSHWVGIEAEDDTSENSSTQFQQMHKN